MFFLKGQSSFEASFLRLDFCRISEREPFSERSEADPSSAGLYFNLDYCFFVLADISSLVYSFLMLFSKM